MFSLSLFMKIPCYQHCYLNKKMYNTKFQMVKLILATSTSSLSIYLEPNPSSLCPHPSDKKKFLSLSSMASMFPKLMVNSQSSPSQSLCSNHHNWSLHPQKADSASVTFFWLLPLLTLKLLTFTLSVCFSCLKGREPGPRRWQPWGQGEGRAQR